jgi:dTDP-4-amino-4,6-dideoxygalactose transaminase
MMTERLRIGQRNLPPWSAVQSGFRAMFARRYFANNGPLVQELDRSIAEFTGARYAVSVTNDMMAMMLLARAAFSPGEVVAPAYLSPVMVEALRWGGFTPVFADVDARSYALSPNAVAGVLTTKTTGIVGVHFMGRLSGAGELETFAREKGVPLIFDGRDALAASRGARSAGTFGRGEVFSLNEAMLLNAAEGGCVTTNEQLIFDRLRTLRNFHPGQTFAEVPLRMNGKMAEAPALLALAGLPSIPESVAKNALRYAAYSECLGGLPGIALLADDDERSSHTRIVVMVDAATAGASAREVRDFLTNEGIEAALPLERTDAAALHGAPAVQRLSERLLELPNAAVMTTEDVQEVGRAIARCVGRP